MPSKTECSVCVFSVVSNSLWLHGLQPTKPFCWWIFPGKNTGMGCHFLLQGIFPTQDQTQMQGKHFNTSTRVATCFWAHLRKKFLLYYCLIDSVQFSSVAQSCPTHCNPMDLSTSGLPVHHQLPEFTQTHVHWVGDAIQPSHPLSFPSSPALNHF